MESDEDCDFMASIYIGETEHKELALQFEEHCNENNDYGHKFKDLENVIAVIDDDSLPIMAEHLGIPANEIYDHLIKKFGDHGYISRIAYIREMFHEMLNYILDCGGKYRFKNK